MNEPKKYSNICKSEKVLIGNDEYEIREMSALESEKYQEESRKSFDDKGNLKSSIGVSAKLITRCLFGPDGKLVTNEFVQGLPSSVQSGLFTDCRKINDFLTEEERKAEPKNG